MMSATTFQLDFVDGLLTPSAVRGRDLSTVVDSVETIVTSTALYEATGDDAATFAKQLDEFYVSLTHIEDRNFRLSFAPSIPQFGIPAWNKVIRSVDRGAFGELSQRTTGAIRKIVKFTKSYGCTAILRSQEIQARAVLNPKTVVSDAPVITADTTVYGYLLRIGGRRPIALMAPLSGGIVRVHINQDIAKALGPRLYSWVGIQGRASWNTETLKIETLKFGSLTNYTGMPAGQAIREMAERYSADFDKVNVDDLMQELRG